MKSRKYRWNIKKFASNLITGISITMIVWFALSYAEIVYKNIMGTPIVFWKFNLIVLLFGF